MILDKLLAVLPAYVRTLSVQKFLYFIVLPLFILILTSYIFMGWSMYPMGDDYRSLYVFDFSHQNWPEIIGNYFATINGRYSQNIFYLPYGFGVIFLKIGALLIIGLVIMTIFFGLRSVGLRRHSSPSTIVLFFISIGIFSLFSLLSYTFPSSRGGIDATFQEFLYYSSAVTYTAPLMLVICLVLYLKSHPVRKYVEYKTPIIILVSYFLGMFSELNDVIVMAACIGFPLLVLLFFGKKQLSRFSKYVKSLVVVFAGQILGLITIYLSPASINRRSEMEAKLNLAGAGFEASHHLAIYLINYFTNSFSLKAGFICLLACTLVGWVVGNSIGFRFLSYMKVVVFSGIIYVTFLWITIFFVILGYGSYQVLPRLEIFYNPWLLLAICSMGMAIGTYLYKLPQPINRILIFTTAAIILISIPYILTRTTNRLAVVVNNSQAWSSQDARLTKKRGVGQAEIRLFDIGDSYHLNCSVNDPSYNWLGDSMEKYYNIKHICLRQQ